MINTKGFRNLNPFFQAFILCFTAIIVAYLLAQTNYGKQFGRSVKVSDSTSQNNTSDFPGILNPFNPISPAYPFNPLSPNIQNILNK